MPVDNLNPLPSIVGVNGGVDGDGLHFEDGHGDGEDDESAYADANGDVHVSSNDDMEYEDDDASADGEDANDDAANDESHGGDDERLSEHL